MTSSSNTIPVLEIPEVPVRYFTVRPEDYHEVESWMKEWKFEYGRFFASFINHAINAAKSYKQYALKTPCLELATLSVFGYAIPFQTEGFLDALKGYAELYERGVTAGPVNLDGGRVAGNDELENAQKCLARHVYSNEKQKEALEKFPYLGWVFGVEKKKQQNKKKNTRRKANKAATALEGLELEE